MSFVTVQLDPAVKARFMASMAEDADLAKQALNSAVRKTGSWARSESLRVFSAGMGITQANLNKGKRVAVRASGTGIFDIGDASGVFANSFRMTTAGGRSTRTQTSVWIGTNDLKLIYLKAKARQTKQGVLQDGELYEHAFLALMQSGHIGVFQREGRERLPIMEIGKPVDASAIFGDMQGKVEEKLAQILDHELDYYFSIRRAA